MSSFKDTFTSKATTPFERRRGQGDTFNSRRTTPFEGRRGRRVSTVDLHSSDLEVFDTDSRPYPRGLARWLVMACMTLMVGMAIWAVGGDF